jgi:hypothetical protein
MMLDCISTFSTVSTATDMKLILINNVVQGRTVSVDLSSSMGMFQYHTI